MIFLSGDTLLHTSEPFYSPIFVFAVIACSAAHKCEGASNAARVAGRPEHGAVEADGSLPVFERGLPSQAHKLLWADELLVELLGGGKLKLLNHPWTRHVGIIKH